MANFKGNADPPPILKRQTPEEARSGEDDDEIARQSAAVLQQLVDCICNPAAGFIPVVDLDDSLDDLSDLSDVDLTANFGFDIGRLGIERRVPPERLFERSRLRETPFENSCLTRCPP